MTKLLIVESPGKIKKIQSILGGDWVVAASIGHVRDMPEKKIGVAPPNFNPQYVPTERGAQQIAKLRTLAAKSDDVYLGTDADREGEAIAWHLKESVGLKTPKRVTFREIEASAIRQAIAAPRTIDMKLVAAQEARRVLDRLVGYMVSGPLSQVTGQKLSAGRVQSPTVKILVERERAIRGFKKTVHFGAKLIFDGEWFAEWNTKPMLPKSEPYWMDKAFAEKVAAVRLVTVDSFETADARRSPPAPFTTVTLQQAAYNRLKFNPDVTMRLAQKLYEQGLITYMRTDATNLSDEAMANMSAEAVRRGLKLVSPVRKWKSKASAQEAHEAVRPTHFEADKAGETVDEQKLYRLIWERTIASQIEDAVYSVRKASLIAIVDGRNVEFRATGRTLKRKGWLAVLDGDDADADADVQEIEPANPVPELAKSQGVTANNGEVLIKETKPLPRFNKASLVKEIESEGIGRPSTYATIIATIEGRGYVEDKRDKLYATSKAEVAYDAMQGRFSFFELPFTKLMEERLDLIADGKDGYRATITDFFEQLQNELAALPANSAAQGGESFPCPSCGKPLRQITGKKGGFWGCTSYPECKTTLPDDHGKPGVPGQVSGAGVSGAGAPDSAGTGKTLGVPCPKCAGEIAVQDKLFTCRGCDFRVWRNIAGKSLTVRDAVKLFKTGELPTMDGFTSKSGKSFSAGLRLSKDKCKVEFVFNGTTR
jgi:DNA topoisomerase-1